MLRIASYIMKCCKISHTITYVLYIASYVVLMSNFRQPYVATFAVKNCIHKSFCPSSLIYRIIYILTYIQGEVVANKLRLFVSTIQTSCKLMACHMHSHNRINSYNCTLDWAGIPMGQLRFADTDQERRV